MTGVVPAEHPFVTVIMPVRNEGAFIAESLGAVLSQDYPSDRLEVLVADGMSTDGTRRIVDQVVTLREGVSVRVLENRGGIVPTGFNEALRVAKGDIVVRVDGHTVIASEYVRECVAALGRSGADNVGGRMVAVSDGAFGRATSLATSSPFGVGGARFHYSSQEEWVDTVYLGCWRREIFARIGGFDEEMVRNQDDEFNYRLASAGGRILLSPRIRSVYYNRSSVRKLWKQYFQYGYWKVRVMQKHPAQMKLRHFAPACFVLALTAISLSSAVAPVARQALGVLVGIYLAASLAASLWAVRGSSWRLLPLMPLAFLTIHLAYGSGFLTGLLQFASLWSAPRAVVPAVAGNIRPERDP